MTENPTPPEDLALALEAPVIDTTPGERYDESRMDYGMTLGIEQTPGGSLWLGWIGGGDNDLGYLLLARSADRGRTWSRPLLVIDPTDSSDFRRRTLVATLWTDPRGRLWLFFDQAMGYFDGRAGVWAIRCDDPDADRPRWSEPVRLADGAALQKPTVTSTGEWLLPVSLWPRWTITDDRLRETFGHLDPVRGANVYVSTDEGRTWSWRSRVQFPDPTFDEHTLVELRDGRLWMFARTNSGPAEAFSNDGGRTWSEPRFSAIRSVTARAHVSRLRSGRLLLIKNGDAIAVPPAERSTLSAFLSDDDGATWAGPLVLDDRDPVTYPEAVQFDDGEIVVSYDFSRKIFGDVLTARITEDDILAGALISPDSQLRVPAKTPALAPGRIAGA